MINLEYVVLIVVIGLITYLRKALDLFGSIFMIVMGIIIIFTAGANWLMLIFIFLLLGLISTKYKHQYKTEIGVYEGTRSLKNVISNGIVPFVMAAFGNYGGFIGSIATATADTLASEVGVVEQPRLITTLKKGPSRNRRWNFGCWNSRRNYWCRSHRCFGLYSWEYSLTRTQL